MRPCLECCVLCVEFIATALYRHDDLRWRKSCFSNSKTMCLMETSCIEKQLIRESNKAEHTAFIERIKDAVQHCWFTHIASADTIVTKFAGHLAVAETVVSKYDQALANVSVCQALCLFTCLKWLCCFLLLSASQQFFASSQKQSSKVAK